MDIQDLRKQIDQADEQLIQAFIQRMEAARCIALYKRKNGLPVLDVSRERQVVHHAAAACPEELEPYVRQLYGTLFDVSRSYQQQHTGADTHLADSVVAACRQTGQLFPTKALVACQGIEGAYSQQASTKLFSMPSILYMKRFEGVFQAVENGMCQYGMLPIENSSHGSVTEVYDLMRKYRFFIVRSVRLKIDHHLLAMPGVELDDIKEVISHEQALGQCSVWLNSRKDLKVTVCENTAVAAQRVAQSGRRDVAAISALSCAKLYDLCVLAEGISNSDSNYTRFICISKKMEIYPGANRMSLLLTLPHKPGALYGIIAKFAALGINLTKLESRPIDGSDFDFRFYFDLDASVYDSAALRLLDQLKDECVQLTYLGSYSEV